KHDILASGITTGDRVSDAVLQIVAEDDPADALQGRLGGGELIQDLGAGLVLLQHLVETADLPLDPLQAGREVLLEFPVEVDDFQRVRCSHVLLYPRRVVSVNGGLVSPLIRSSRHWTIAPSRATYTRRGLSTCIAVRIFPEAVP